MDHHAAVVEEIGVEAILAFAEEVLPSAAHWTHAGLDQRQRLQQSFFPEAITVTGIRSIEPP
jgi:hypothetical protein